jgi:hypothetical protein
VRVNSRPGYQILLLQKKIIIRSNFQTVNRKNQNKGAEQTAWGGEQTAYFVGENYNLVSP